MATSLFNSFGKRFFGKDFVNVTTAETETEIQAKAKPGEDAGRSKIDESLVRKDIKSKAITVFLSKRISHL